MEREIIDVNSLELPNPPVPMPGDRVFWYDEAIPNKGVLTGHNFRCQPIIRSAWGNESTPFSYWQIRLDDPTNRIGPNWKRLPDGGAIYRALPEEIARFDDVLKQHIPPGPKYYELITEIWHRGFEIYLVGGTVRDVINGSVSYDVDLVTTMPLRLARPLLKSMYRYEPTMNGKHGFVRIGGTPESGDPFIDLKSFCVFQLGTESAVFGSDFERDVAFRDFSCNSVYYDPINKTFIDPSGRGLDDAKQKRLFIVLDPEIQKSDYRQATIVIRFFKFVCRQFTYSSETQRVLTEKFLPKVPAMDKFRKIKYIKTQLLSKHPKAEHVYILDEFRSSMVDFGIIDFWDAHFAPHVKEILS